MESVTPQSKIDTVYQSKTEKGIRKICFELLDLKDAVENLCSNTRTKYLAFLRAFDDLKKYLASPLLLVKPPVDGPLGLYLAISDYTMAAALVDVIDGLHRPIYFVSKVLNSAEMGYTPMEKVVFALLMASRKLLAYFQGRRVMVYTDMPLEKVLCHPESSGRMIAFTTELSQFDFEFIPRRSVRAQILPDFIVECTPSSAVEVLEDDWEMFIDDSTLGGFGAGIVFLTAEREPIYAAIKLDFLCTNNIAEYEALCSGLALARELGVRHLRAYSDSQLVVGQFNGQFAAIDPRMASYCAKVKDLACKFANFSLSHIVRELNTHADMLARLASTLNLPVSGSIIVQVRTKPTVIVKTLKDEHSNLVGESQTGNSWMDEYIQYFTNGALPADRIGARRLLEKSKRFSYIKGVLYRKHGNGTLLRCLSPHEAQEIMEDVHQGVCGNHESGRTLVLKIVRQGFFWPCMGKECASFAKKCPTCQYHAKVFKKAPTLLEPVPISHPFAIWGIDVLGPLPIAKRQMRYVLVAIEYFSKWIEAEAYATVTVEKVKNFVYRNVLARFGIPRVIVCDNGTPFESQVFKSFCSSFGIEKRAVAVAHPQANGLVEAANGVLKSAIKKKLETSATNGLISCLKSFGPSELRQELPLANLPFLWYMAQKLLHLWNSS